MDVDDLLVHEGAVSFLRVFLGSVPEETAENGFLYARSVLPTRHDI